MSKVLFFHNILLRFPFWREFAAASEPMSIRSHPMQTVCKIGIFAYRNCRRRGLPYHMDWIESALCPPMFLHHRFPLSKSGYHF